MEEPKTSPKELIQAAARQLQQDFEEIRATNPHAGESGAEAEMVLRKFLKERLPKRFDIETGIVIGGSGTVSRQTDLIVYDAFSSPVYRAGPRVHIIPRDSVAAVVEVKSKLNKEELKDAAVKIASVKGMRPSPITNLDQPVTFSSLINANALGCVFAYDSYTTLETLAKNLQEINENQDSREWIDLVVVLGKGIISFAVQFPFSQKLPGWFGGTTDDEFTVFPFYVHLVRDEEPDLALNQFFTKLMSHLAFFRKRTTVDIQGILGPEQKAATIVQGYQYNLKRQLVPAEKAHQQAHFQNPKIRYNLYFRSNRTLCGQVGYWSWQDGAVITCSVRFDQNLIFKQFSQALQQRVIAIPAGDDMNLWLSSVLPISEEDFIRASEEIHPDLISVRDTDDDDPPPVKLPDDHPQGTQRS